MDGKQKHLAINLIQLLPEFSGGIETYARELIPRVIDRLPGWQVSVFVNSEGAAAYPEWDQRADWIAAGLSWHSGPKRIVWESSVLPLKVRRLAPNLLHNMTNTACLHPGCPQLTTIFDATQVLQPAPSLPSKAFRQLLKASPRRSDQILTISASAAADVASAFDAPQSKIKVVLLAAREPHPALERAAIEQRFDLPAGAPYFLTPASRRPNKNIARLLEAFAQLDPEARPLLLLAGADGGKDAEFAQLIDQLGITDSVRLLGWITDEELDSLYAHGLALVFPSLMEGFGLPILEAMQSGCAVATSDRSSMPEVAGEHALFFDPEQETEIAGAMRTLAGDQALRERLRAGGLKRAAEFSWDRTADETVAIYKELAR